MGIQGMELCAVAVVIMLFIAVLKQFGILEPMSMEGNTPPCLSLQPGSFPWPLHQLASLTFLPQAPP